MLFGDYRVLKKISEGTLGSVFIVEHNYIKKIFVAKVIDKSFSEKEGFLDSFKAGVESISSLEFDHILKTHNVSKSAQDDYFLVSDYIVDCFGKTTNLSNYMFNKTEMDEFEVFNILEQVALAIDYAHSKGISHNAIKPNNIILGNDRYKDSVKVYLSDFCISSMIPRYKGIKTTFDNVAAWFGSESDQEEKFSAFSANDSDEKQKLKSYLQSFMFMAPEQKVLGQRDDTKIDIYSFGLLAYWMLLKEHPEGVFKLPSQVLVDSVIDWDSIIVSCLQRDPAERPLILEPLLKKAKENKRSSVSWFSSDLILRDSLDKEKQNDILDDVVSISNSLVGNCSSEVVSKIESKQCLAKKSGEGVEDLFLYQTEVALLEEKEIPKVHFVKPQPLEAPKIDCLFPNPGFTEEELALDPDKKRYAEELASLIKREPVVTQYNPSVSKAAFLKPILTEMVFVKGGMFARGSDSGQRDEAPAHNVILNSFAIDIHPVTNEQYVRFLEHFGVEQDCDGNELIRLKSSRIYKRSGKYLIEPGYNTHPVVGVTWYGSKKYVDWVGKRLPTEAEWEIAAIGGKFKLYPTGDEINKSQANFFGFDTTAVMTYPKNGCGLYDMVGNVYEWCEDWYSYDYYEICRSEPTNPIGPSQGVYRSLRGGCWKSVKEDLRCSHRHRNNPGTVNSTYGFRCAVDVK